MSNKARTLLRSILLLTWISVEIVLSSCGISDPKEVHVEPSIVSETSYKSAFMVDQGSPSYEFPKSVKLLFEHAEITELTKEKVRESWEYIKTIPFGQIDGEQIALAVYKEHDDGAVCGSSYERIVLLEYKKEKYRYNDCFSTSLEAEHPEEQNALFLLGDKQEGRDSTLSVHGAAELSANGPGRMVYFYFNARQGRWFGFEEWGYPGAVDFDDDGTSELVIQFPGLHLAWPDITIYHWNGHVIEKSLSIKRALGLPNISYSQATLDSRDHRMNVVAVMSIEPARNKMASYQYQNGELVRMDGQ